MNKNKDDVACNCTDHTTKWILTNSFGNYDPIFKQRSIDIDNQKYISEVESLLEYFYKIKHTSINRKLFSKIFNNLEFSFAFVFYYYQDSLFDVSIHLRNNVRLIYNDIIRKEEFMNLEAPLNSSILSKTLEKCSQIKQLIFSSKDYYLFTNPDIHISFSANTLTINWSQMNLDYLNLLLELGPGLILRLKYLKFENNCWDLDLIQRFLSYCARSPPCSKLSFSKLVIHIDIEHMENSIFIESYENVSKLKHLVDSLSNIYDVELENISYEDLFINRTDYFKQCIERWRDMYNDKKLKFERIWENRMIPWWFFNNTNDDFNQTIEELKLKEFKFYADKIKLKRYY